MCPETPEQKREKALRPVFRWGYQTKIALMRSIMEGHVSQSEALKAHGLCTDELVSWFDAIRFDGAAGIKQLRWRARRKTAQ